MKDFLTVESPRKNSTTVLAPWATSSFIASGSDLPRSFVLMYGIKRTKKKICQDAFFLLTPVLRFCIRHFMLDVEITTKPSVQVRNGGLSLQQTNPPKSSLLAFQHSGRLLLFEWGVCYV